MLPVLEDIYENSREVKFTHAVCDALGLDSMEKDSLYIAEQLTTQVMQEIHRRYQLCPLDKNGKPIHSGDYLDTVGKVQAIGEDMVCAGELIYSDEPPCYSGYPIFSSDAYETTSPYREVLRDFAREHGVEVSSYTLGVYESRLKALQ